MALVKSMAELEALFWAELMEILGFDTSVTATTCKAFLAYGWRSGLAYYG